MNPIFKKYRNGDFIQYINNVLDIITATRATSLNIANQRETLATQLEALTTIWQPNKGSELTPQIADLDKQRDAIFSGLKATVDAWAVYHFNTDKKDAALLIANTINAHGSQIQRLRYQQETAVLNAIINDLDNELSAQISALNLNDWVTLLKTTNTAFDEKYLERAQALSGQETGAVETARNTITAAFKTLIEIFTARKAIAEVENAATVDEYLAVYNEVNSITQQYNDAVTKYASSSESEETVTDTNTTGDE